MDSRACGLVAGMLLDAVVGDPQRHHPVAWFGTFAGAVEQRVHADSRARGAAFTAATVGPVVAAGVLAERLTRRHWWAHTAATALVTWVVVGQKSLSSEGQHMAQHLAAEDLTAARERLPHLCGRHAEALDAPELARATVESMAENTADAVVASLFWGAIAGVPGMLGHRAVNTLDAMVGHRTPRHGRFGTASARLDDAADWLPARATGALACALAGLVGGSPRRAWRTMRRDARKHPSPNGGWCEAAWAGALGVQLGGTNVYFGRTEERGLLGEGPRPDASATCRAAVLVSAVSAAATGIAAVLAAGGRRSCRGS